MELKDFETLLQAQEYTITKGRMISPDMMVAFLAMFSIGRAVEVEDTEAAFVTENAGRNVYIQSANKYRIDMSGKKSGEYEIRVPLLDADFTVELV